MKNFFYLAISLFIPFYSSAALLEDVKVLTVNPQENSLELKLQVKSGPSNSHFFVSITDSDPKAFEKSILVVSKLKQKEKFKLTLDIPSFSASPSGSYYKSDGVTFSGSEIDKGINKKKSK